MSKQNITYFPNLLHVFNQETSNPETKDKVSVEAENLDHKDATEIKAEEGTYAQQLTDVEMLKSEREGN